jgi:uncharacterized protein (DUF433 family)
LAAYALTEAAHYLLIPGATLRSWTLGRPYLTRGGKRFFQPVLIPPAKGTSRLSFINIVEAHVLDSIRKKHKISLDKVRIAIEYLRQKLGSQHPLADFRFQTDGVDLFLERYGELVNVSRAGQMAMREMLQAHLQRVDRDSKGRPIRLYPFTRREEIAAPKLVMMDPRIAFGRPVLAGTGIPTAVIAERYKAGDSVEVLATDYGRDRLEIEEAIRCELQLEAA